MSADPVSRLNAALDGRYRVERELGQGGMATVYLAEDLKHGRKVALKVLKPELAAVVGAKRFLAEIRTTANLQHPHILPLHDSGEADGLLFYVMPYVDGESLRDRLDRVHQLPIDDAVRIATNMAEALDYAHRQGVIHRDIKPANVLLQDGKPVISDFGIALAVGAAGGGRLTETGLSLGTPHYMSPEQATGDQNVGPATDIYALGCVLYEVLVGEPPFTGSTPQAVLGRIITGEVPSVTSERSSVPPNVDAVIARALEKMPADRFSHAGALAQALADPEFRHGARATGGRGWWSARALGVGALIGGFTVALAWWLVPAPAGPPEAWSILPPADVVLDAGLNSPPAVSPDASTVAFAATARGEDGQLYLKRADELETTVVRGSSGARDPFFSPDGQWVAFFTPTGLRKAPVRGGPSSIVCLCGEGDGAWLENDTIVFGVWPGNLLQVPASGGEPAPLRMLDESAGETSHESPRALPGGGMLYGVRREPPLQDEIRILREGESRTVWSGTSHARYGGGRLLFVDGAALFSVALDVEEARITGEPVEVLDDMMVGSSRESDPDFDVAYDGTIVYVPGSSAPAARSLVRVSRDGDAELVPTPVEWVLNEPTLSPVDSTLLLFESSGEVWTFDVVSNTRRQVTVGGGASPRWTPDGREIVYRSVGAAPYAVLMQLADGQGEPRRIVESPRTLWPDAVTPDGGTLVLVRSPGDIMAMPLDGSGTLRPLVEDEAQTWSLGLSPDGRWLTYVTDRDGRFEVYVMDFSAPASRWRVSSGGGTQPLWSPSGDELFYRDGDRMMVVSVLPVEPDAAFRFGPPRMLFEGAYRSFSPGLPQYAVAADAQSFFMLQVEEAREIRVLRRWTSRTDR